jgi:GNAT superfamily N-acetyltransferase
MASSPAARISVRRTYLELRSRDDLRPAREPVEPVQLAEHRPIAPADYVALYRLVGERWLWRDRLAWSTADLERYLGSPDVHVWVARLHGTTAGYFELLRHADGPVEVMYFGLAPSFIGRGLGGWLLTRAAEESFALGATRVVLNTCTLDAPQALPNYLARGFTIVREDSYVVEVPESSRAGDLVRHVATRS